MLKQRNALMPDQRIKPDIYKDTFEQEWFYFPNNPNYSNAELEAVVLNFFMNAPLKNMMHMGYISIYEKHQTKYRHKISCPNKWRI